MNRNLDKLKAEIHKLETRLKDLNLHMQETAPGEHLMKLRDDLSLELTERLRELDALETSGRDEREHVFSLTVKCGDRTVGTSKSYDPHQMYMTNGGVVTITTSQGTLVDLPIDLLEEALDDIRRFGKKADLVGFVEDFK